MANYDWVVKGGADFGDVFKALKGLSTAGQQAGTDIRKGLNTGIDKLPGDAKKASDSLGKLGDAGRKAGEGAKAAAAGVGDVGRASFAALPGVDGLLSSLAGFISAGAAVAFVVAEIKKLDDGSAAVRTLGVNAEALNASLLKVSQATGGAVSQVELLKAAYDVASSGFSSAADATAILEAATFGARGGFADLNTVADATTSVLNAYGLSADNAAKIVDGFITTQNDGKIIVSQYAAEIGNVASISAAAGVSIEELNAAIAAATAKGVPVAQTFTGLRQAISSILKPTSEAKELAGSLGLSFNAQALQAKGLGGFLEDVNRATKGNVALNTVLFSSVEAVAAVQPLLNDGLEKYNAALKNQQNNAGAAKQAYGEIATTISEATARVTGSLSNLAIQSGGLVTPALIAGLNSVSGALNGISANLGTVVGTATGIATLVAVLNATAIATTVVTIATKGYAAATKAAAVASAVLQGIIAGPAGLAKVAIGLAAGLAAAAAVKASIDGVTASSGSAADSVGQLVDKQTEAVAGAKQAADLAAVGLSIDRERRSVSQAQINDLRSKLDAQTELNNLERQGAARRLEDQIAVGSAALSLGKASADLESSRFDIAKARNDFLIAFYQEQGGQEQRIAGLKLNNEQIDARALEARFAALVRTQKIEETLLSLQQQKAQTSARLAETEARIELNKQNAAVRLAESSGDVKAIAEAQVQRDLAAERLSLLEQASKTLGITQPIEAAIAAASAEQARNGLLAQGARQGIEGNLRAIQTSLQGTALSIGQITATNLQAFFGAGAQGAGDLNQQLRASFESTQQLTREFAKLTGLDTIRAGRFTGGPVVPGSEYTVNELGQESFMDAAGNLSLINRPAFAAWRPPSPGLVIPAGVTADLKARGGLSPRGGNAMAQMAGAVGNLTRQVADLRSAGSGSDSTLAAAVRELRSEVRRLTDKDWHATVVAPAEPSGLAIARRYRKD